MYVNKVVIRQESSKPYRFYTIFYLDTEFFNYAYMHSNGMLFHLATDTNGFPTGWFDTVEEAQKVLEKNWRHLNYEIEYSCVQSTPTK